MSTSYLFRITLSFCVSLYCLFVHYAPLIRKYLYKVYVAFECRFRGNGISVPKIFWQSFEEIFEKF